MLLTGEEAILLGKKKKEHITFDRMADNRSRINLKKNKDYIHKKQKPQSNGKGTFYNGEDIK